MEKLRNLLTVKSIVTLVLTLVFAYMAVRGEISRDFMTIYVVVISFYFGTQHAKQEETQSAAAAISAVEVEEADADAV